MSDWLSPLMKSLLFASPVFIVYGIAALLALGRWKQHPTVSMLVVLAAVISTIFRLATTFLYVWLPTNIDEFGWDAMKIGRVFSGINLVAAVVQSLALAMIFAAVFIGRDGRQPDAKHSHDASTPFAKD